MRPPSRFLMGGELLCRASYGAGNHSRLCISCSFVNTVNTVSTIPCARTFCIFALEVSGLCMLLETYDAHHPNCSLLLRCGLLNPRPSNQLNQFSVIGEEGSTALHQATTRLR